MMKLVKRFVRGEAGEVIAAWVLSVCEIELLKNTGLSL